MSLYADVVLPLPLERTFSYSIPAELEDKVRPGIRVLVPFGKKTQTAFVVGMTKRKRSAEIKLKPVSEVLDEAPIFSPAFLAFAEKLSRAFFASQGEILQAAVPPSLIVRSKALISLTPRGREALSRGALSDEERAVAGLLEKKAHRPRFLERSSGLQNFSAFLSRMEKQGLVAVSEEIKRVRRKKSRREDGPPKQLELDFSFDENLSRAVETIRRAMAGRTFAPFLLCGVPRKREAVYFQLIKEALSLSGRVLYLVPEISLTPALLDKLAKRLGDAAAVLHSRLAERQREAEWQKIREGRAGIVVGSRSALFSPLDGIRLIILDEEHDDSYSPQEGTAYDIRQGAWLRAKAEKAALVMGSAMPTVEATYRARKGGYLIDLGTESQGARVTVVDSRKESGVVCRPLKEKIRERLERGEPVLLFFNRRGYAAYLFCGRCRFVPRCRRCELALAYHKKEDRLVCHHCRYSLPRMESCPRCGSRLIERRGAGIEAVAEELKKTFPQRRVEVFAADEASRKEEKAGLLEGFRDGRVDVLVGTRLLAHQLGLPPVSLVGIIQPEMILNLADFRSGQKAFQAIARATSFLRDDRRSEAVIQTAAPEHFIIREAARGDYRAFYEAEIKFRRLMDYPPFSARAEVIFQGENPRRVAETSREFVARVKGTGERVEVYGPSLAAVPRMKGLCRVQVSLKARRRDVLDRILPLALKGINLKKSVFLLS